MSHERFLADIAAHPDDDAPKLVYADWLEERGDKRADFIRLVVEGVNGREATEEELCEAVGLPWRDNDFKSTIRSADLSRELWPWFAADCAERALPVFEKAFPGDERPRKAVEAVRTASVFSAARAARTAAARAARAAYVQGAVDRDAERRWQLIRLAEYKVWGRAVGLWSGE
ncbi:MAG: TIGR02996 domain-containing protein [Planctomycetales bacterium]